MGNTAQHCRLGLFQDSDFAGDLEDSKSTSGWILCIVGSRTFVPISWRCKKLTSVSHSSTESEISSLDAGLRMYCVLVLDLLDVVMDVFLSSSNVPPTQKISTPKSKPRGAAGNCVRDNVHNIRLRKEGYRNVDQLSKSRSCDHKCTLFLLTPKQDWRTLPDCSKFQRHNVHICKYMDTSPTTHIAQNHGQTLKIQWSSSTTFERTSTCWPLVGKAVREVLLDLDWKKVPN